MPIDRIKCLARQFPPLDQIEEMFGADVQNSYTPYQALGDYDGNAPSAVRVKPDEDDGSTIVLPNGRKGEALACEWSWLDFQRLMVRIPSNEAWQRQWELHVMSHVYAGRAVLPSMLARGEGYLMHTASAAGLLLAVGSAPYSVTKAACIKLAEYEAITHGDAGIGVSVLCPQGVNTDMLRSGDDPAAGPASGVVRSAGRVLEPAEVAEVVVQAIRDERFLILPHAEVHDFMQRKAADHDRWLAGMRRLQSRIAGGA